MLAFAYLLVVKAQIVLSVFCLWLSMPLMFTPVSLPELSAARAKIALKKA